MPHKLVDLSPPITEQLNAQRLGSRTLEFLGTHGRSELESVLPEDPTLAFGLQILHMPTHTGAHIDAPARLLRGGEPPGRIGLDRLIGPARIIDLRWHDRSSAIEISDLEISDLGENEILILFLGYEPPIGQEWPQYAPLSKQAAEWLVAKGIRALATDVPAIVNFADLESRLREGQPPAQVWAEYLPLFRARIPILAGLTNLASIVDESAIVLIGFPLPLAEGGGAPVRAVALIY